MPYVLIAHDATDADAPARRAEHRPAHLELISRLKDEGKAILGCPLMVDDETSEQMNGSLIVLDFANKAELDAYLAEEPFVTHKVWGDVQIKRCTIGPAWR